MMWQLLRPDVLLATMLAVFLSASSVFVVVVVAEDQWQPSGTPEVKQTYTYEGDWQGGVLEWRHDEANEKSTFLVLLEGKVYQGLEMKDLSDKLGGTVASMHVNPDDPSRVVLLGTGGALWTSEDYGETFSRHDTPASKVFQRVSMDPADPAVFLASSTVENACDNEDCADDLYITRDFGATFELLVKEVRDFSWAPFNYSLVYILVNQISDNDFPWDQVEDRLWVNDGDVGDMVIYDIRSNQATLALPSILSLSLKGDYAFVLQRVGTLTEYWNEIYVSWRGNPFLRAEFSNNEEPRNFEILDVQFGDVVLFDMPSTDLSATPTFGNNSEVSGDLFHSDWSGTKYSISLKGLLGFWFDSVPLINFHVVESMEGTFIGTFFEEGKKTSASRITWNRGSTWEYVQTVEMSEGTGDSDQLFVLMDDIQAINGNHKPIVSTDHAPGYLVAAGTLSSTVLGLETNIEINMYFSYTGGKTFKKIREGPQFCDFVFDAFLLVCVAGGQETTTLSVGVFGGTDWKWKNVTWKDPLLVQGLYVDPNQEAGNVLIVGKSSADTESKTTFLWFNMADLKLAKCTESDYSEWRTQKLADNSCLLGHRILYRRPKPGSICAPENHLPHIIQVENCPCGHADFECDFQYELNKDGLCEATTDIPRPPCVNGVSSVPTGYRKIPGDTCNQSLADSYDYSVPTATDCAFFSGLVDDTMIAGLVLTVLFLLLVICCVGSYLFCRRKALFVYYATTQRKRRWRSLRNRGDAESIQMLGQGNGGRGVGDNGNEDNDQDNDDDDDELVFATRGDFNPSGQLTKRTVTTNTNNSLK